MSSGFELIYQNVPIGANLFKYAENEDSVMFKYVKSYSKQVL